MEDPPRPLKVSIVGAGIGGLTAALSLRKNGHHTRIFEVSQIKTEIGAGVALQPNALRVLQHLGLPRDNLKGRNFDGIVMFDGKTGDGTVGPWLVPEPEPECRGLNCHRSDLHDELKRLAIGDGEGPPAQLHLGTQVVSCDPDTGTITLEGGEIVHADVIIGADGIHSTLRTSILDHPVKAPLVGLSCFRCLLDPADLSTIPDLEWLTDGIHGARSVAWRGGPMRNLFIYYVRNSTLINVVAYFMDPDQDKLDWAPTATKEELIEQFSDYHPKFLRLFDLPLVGPVLKWQLKAVPLLPTWIRGHAALLGDAAHATLPFLGQGAAMAIEEAGTLGTLLPLGTAREDVPARLEAYQTLRKERGEFVNTESVAQAMVPEKRGFYLRSPEMQALLQEHDTIKVAQDYFDAHFDAKMEI
ncbi:FAD/NAD(P)-binding domain-containing protein [Mycena maculata]|uniref:FAD/NAD(P)-binding domain-containing protein n=1 Tax=Mycena maculata TaxID=230809 RepID=A0AAD7I9I6_9AGAR|nr:FAD/NAD(P)-binding domain-containing protein [Mycena maculata]